jgi:DNA-binding MarR family transcriptional regulator
MKPAQDDKTVLHLFTEIAIVEHLLRNRYDRATPAGMSTAQFGVLTHFIRNAKSEERMSLLAWAFQDSEDYMAEKVASLVQRGMLAARPIDGATGDMIVAITDQGRRAHADALDEIWPEIAQLLEGIDMDDLRTSLGVIQEIRRTLDNLPDR